MMGREAEADALTAALAAEVLVAVHGPMGIGKTALAMQVAASGAELGRLAQPALVSLARVTDLRGVLEHAARALGRGRPSAHDGGVAPAVARLLESVPATLILDDADQLAPAEL